MRIDILDKLFERLDIWSSLVDPQFSVPDSRFSNLDFRFSNLDLQSVILDPWFPKILGSRIEFRVETVINVLMSGLPYTTEK